MNKKVNIEKTIDFSKSISDITAISLEHNLRFLDSENIEGSLMITGKYKTTLAAEIEEDFNYKIPVEITLTDSLDLESAKVDIDDFSYNVVEDKALSCSVVLNIEGDIIEDDRKCDDDLDTSDLDLPKIDNKIETLEEEKKDEELIDNSREEVTEVSNSIFNIDNNNETYGTFIVYIVRQNETINTIISKYNTTLEEIEKYNDLKDLSIGKKLIIPLLKNEED